MINFVICDDNVNILDKLPKMLENIFLKYNYDACIGFKSDDFDEIVEYVGDNKTDVLILDINLKNGKNGLDIAEIVRRKNKNAYLIYGGFVFLSKSSYYWSFRVCYDGL